MDMKAQLLLLLKPQAGPHGSQLQFFPALLIPRCCSSTIISCYIYGDQGPCHIKDNWISLYTPHKDGQNTRRVLALENFNILNIVHCSQNTGWS